MTEREPDILNKFERQYMDIFGELYQKRGLPKGIGQLYAILLLKARTPENGLDQQTLSLMINRSVSTVSRLMQVLVNMGLCNYTEILNDSKRLERKYYIKSNLKDIALQRFQQIIDENKKLKQSLQSLEPEIEQKKYNDFKKFLIKLEQEIHIINKLYSEVITLSEKIF